MVADTKHEQSEAEIEERGNYRYACTVKQDMDDPVNDIEAGAISVVAGKCEDGVIRTVADDEAEDFVDITGEVIERFHADTRMTRADITSWAVGKAKESEVDYDNV